MHEDPGEGSVEKRRMAEAGLHKKVRRRRRMMMKRKEKRKKKKKKSTACRGKGCVAQ